MSLTYSRFNQSIGAINYERQIVVSFGSILSQWAVESTSLLKLNGNGYLQTFCTKTRITCWVGSRTILNGAKDCSVLKLVNIAIPHISGHVMPLFRTGRSFFLSPCCQPTYYLSNRDRNRSKRCVMRDFFHGWRRKTGAATLVLACVFMAGWVRSHSIADVVVIPSTDFTENEVSSAHGLIQWQTTHWAEGMPMGSFHFRAIQLSKWDFDIGEERHITLSIVCEKKPSRTSICGFLFATYSDDDGTLFARLRVVPYWSIVLPITLLSACLLLSKPRQKPKQQVNHA